MIKVHCTFFNRLYNTTSIFLVSKDIKIIFFMKTNIFLFHHSFLPCLSWGVGHLNTRFDPGDGNVNNPNFKSSNARGVAREGGC